MHRRHIQDSNSVGYKAPLKLAITTGEPSGIGPEIVIKAVVHIAYRKEVGLLAHQLYILGDPNLLSMYAQIVGLAREWKVLQERAYLTVVPQALINPVTPGVLDVANAPYVLALLNAAIEGAIHHRFDAVITAPIQKNIINQANILDGNFFSGHTEYFAQRTQSPEPVMLLIGAGFRVALVTTHLPLSKVVNAIHFDKILRILRVLHHDLKCYFNEKQPEILVTGLNPHAGENGDLGLEEKEIIIPAIEAACAEGIKAKGPFPADTIFRHPEARLSACILAMYHDQGLPTFKYASFGKGINVTLGLPIIRTSVDHGTALTLAGSGQMAYGSLLEALHCAVVMARTARGEAQAFLRDEKMS